MLKSRQSKKKRARFSQPSSICDVRNIRTKFSCSKHYYDPSYYLFYQGSVLIFLCHILKTNTIVHYFNFYTSPFFFDFCNFTLQRKRCSKRSTGYRLCIHLCSFERFIRIFSTFWSILATFWWLIVQWSSLFSICDKCICHVNIN